MINDNACNGGGLPAGLQNVYTKKFLSKQARDQKRYVKHHVTHRVTRSQTQNNDCEVR